MFQTEPIRFLQSFSTEWLDRFFWLVSEMGYASFYIPVLLVITFGFNLRRGFLLIQMLLWVGIITNLLKEWFGLPRPFHVDSAVRLIGEGFENPTPHAGMGGHGVWGLPDSVVEATAYHHEPVASAVAEPTPLTAVHIAQAIANAVDSPPALSAERSAHA